MENKAIITIELNDLSMIDQIKEMAYNVIIEGGIVTMTINTETKEENYQKTGLKIKLLKQP